MKEILFGDLETMGVEVYVENDMVIEMDDASSYELPDTPENREQLISDAKETIEAWKR